MTGGDEIPVDRLSGRPISFPECRAVNGVPIDVDTEARTAGHVDQSCRIDQVGIAHRERPCLVRSEQLEVLGVPCCTRDVVDPVPGYVERDLRKFLECGILAHGFARARCEKCGQDFLVAYSCKGRGMCPGCNTRRMVETAAHLVEHVFPAAAVRQWVVVFPKRLRYFLDRDADCS